MSTYTLDLGDIGQGGLVLAGGKGASLAELTRAGFPVPSGFVVTTTAYTDFVDAIGLGGGDPDQLRARIPEARMPEEISAAVLTAYHELGAPAVAVRSSGTAEDLAGASFAGQHDTFLNVTGEQAVLAAVRDCWASLWTPRAVAYRQRRGWDERGLALAVVVQAMVDAEWAGVMFTADPVTGRRDRIVIQAVRGLGEALVSGAATGNRHVVDKHTGRLVTAGSPLPAGLLDDLARLATKVEDAFGRPQDIEWAYAAGHCSLVQARPLTALPDEAARPRMGPGETTQLRKGGVRPSTGRRRRRLGSQGFGMAADHVPYPPYPMDVSLSVRPAVRALLDAVRSTGFAAPDLEDVLVEIDDGVVQIVPPHVRPTQRALVRVPAALPRLFAALRIRPADWLAQCHATLIELADRIDTTDLAGLSDQELLDRAEELRAAQGHLIPSRFSSAVPRLLADGALAALLRLAVGAERARVLHTDLMAGAPSITRDANRELDRLATAIHDSPELLAVYDGEHPEDIADRLCRFEAGRALLHDVDAYLRRYGRRQIIMPLVGFPPMREIPHVVHGLLGSLARAKREGPGGSGADAPDELRAVRAREQLTAGRAGRTRLVGSVALRLLDAARSGVAFREDSHVYLFMLVAAVARRLLLELGRRLVERDQLGLATDVFYLEMEELTGPHPGSAREIVARRKAAREAALDHYTAVPDELLRQESTAQTIRGAPASRGTAVGPVRIVRDEAEFANLASGEILVCPYTNPAWTPLFSLASAVVADAGGVASHAAIVAREQGIPAVMGAGNATRLLTDGQRVRVDGDNGTVVPLAADAPGPTETANRAPGRVGAHATS